jgi:hypothetical protein
MKISRSFWGVNSVKEEESLTVDYKAHVEDIILGVIKESKPQNVKELLSIVQERINLPEESITSLLDKLENDGKIGFQVEQTSTFADAIDSFVHRRRVWYFATLGLSILAVVFAFVYSENFQIVVFKSLLGMLYIIFLPGYSFMKMLFPEKTFFGANVAVRGNFEGLLFSVGMSLALVSVSVLFLNSTSLVPIVLSLLVLTVLFSTVGFVRENHLLRGENSISELDKWYN